MNFLDAVNIGIFQGVKPEEIFIKLLKSESIKYSEFNEN